MAYQYPYQHQPPQGAYFPPAPASAPMPMPMAAPVPASVAPIDPFRNYYADRLRQLTFNSRPIIQDLSMMAMNQRDQNDWNGMRIVVEEIEVAVLRAPPQAKLPLLYLIDSISKNIGAPYTTHLLPPIIPRMYLRTYREVDGVIKAKMEEMIALWRTSGVNGAELYGASVRESVEREIFGSSRSMSAMGAPAGLGGAAPPAAAPSRQQVLTALQNTLATTHRQSTANPNDAKLSHQVGVLVRIGELLNSTNVSPPELAQIMNQLNSMVPQPQLQPSAHNAYPGSPIPPPTPLWNSQPSLAPAATHGTTYGTPTFPPFPPANAMHHSSRPPFPPNGLSPHPHSSSNTPMQGSSTPLPAAAAAPALAAAPVIPPVILPVDVDKILRSLTSSGLTSQPLTPELKPAELVSGTSGSQPKSTLAAYEDIILNMNLTLESLDLNAMHSLDFDHLPLRCKQCSMRFPGMADGEAQYQAHLDWHFRRNKKERESGGRGAHRRWLPRAEEWTADIPEAGPSTSAGSPSSSKSKSKTAQAATGEVSKEDLARLREKWVVVPQNGNKGSAGCPICKEAFKAEWSDKEEEWVFRNAVNVNGTIYHATCRAEARIQRNKLKALDPRGRTLSRGRTTSGSPNATPQPQTQVQAHPLSQSQTAASGQAEAQAQAQAQEPLHGAIATGVERQDQDQDQVQVQGAAAEAEAEADAAGVGVGAAASASAAEGAEGAAGAGSGEGLAKRKAEEGEVEAETEADQGQAKRVKVDGEGGVDDSPAIMAFDGAAGAV